MTVSNEDRDAAVKHLQQTECVHYEHQDELAPLGGDEARVIVDALIAHGWGPRPRVSPMKLGEFIDQANAGGMAIPWRGLRLHDYLRECGIEVTDDRPE